MATLRSGECADAMLGNDNFAIFGSNRSGNRSQRPFKQFLMLRGGLNSAEENISRTDFRQSGRKPTWTWMTVILALVRLDPRHFRFGRFGFSRSLSRLGQDAGLWAKDPALPLSSLDFCRYAMA